MRRIRVHSAAFRNGRGTMLIGIDASRAAAAERTGTENYALHLIRALVGLRERLAGRNMEVELVQPDIEQLRSLPMPLITPLRYEASRLHMVVIWRINEKGVWLDDPVSGTMVLKHQEFEPLYTGQVLVFNRS